MDLGDLAKGVLGGGGSGGAGGAVQKLLPVVMGMLQSGKLGGLEGLLGKFQAAGLGGKAQSWVSDGDNDAVSGDEVERALGADTVDDIAKEAGVSKEDAKGGLAELLPNLINGVTPGGKLPVGGLGDVAGQLGGLLKGFGK